MMHYTNYVKIGHYANYVYLINFTNVYMVY